MYHKFRNASEALPVLLRHVLDGEEMGSRGGRVKEQTFQHIELTHPWERIITTPGRNASLPAQIAETMWVLAGRDDIGWLSNYLPRAKDFSDNGETWRGAYGTRLRRWGFHVYPFSRTELIDQLANVVKLLKDDALTRRAVMTIYDPVVDMEDGKDIPCNNWIHFLSRSGKLDMHVAIRSNDLMWGWSGINAFEWSALQEIVAGMLGIQVGSLHFSISSLHLYERHWQRANRIASGTNGTLIHNQQRSSFYNDPPRFDASVFQRSIDSFDELVLWWFEVEKICREKDFTRADNAIRSFPEPMLRSWLRVIRWYWTDLSEGYDPDLSGNTTISIGVAATPVRLHRKYSAGSEQALKALKEPIKEISFKDGDLKITLIPVEEKPEINFELEPVTGETWPEEYDDQGNLKDPVTFWDFVADLHEQKHLAYGDSWKRRGEMLGIMANIARKMDRLGVAGAGDTAADTAIDLLVYLIKYRLWLHDYAGASLPEGLSTDYADPISDLAAPVTEYLGLLGKAGTGHVSQGAMPSIIRQLNETFQALEQASRDQSQHRVLIVTRMIDRAHDLAYELWSHEQWQAGNADRAWKGYA